MTESSDNEMRRILSKVRKMMALANDAAASEGERENALRMTHAILAKHNLTMAEAEASGASEEVIRGGANFVEKDQPWACNVSYHIAGLFYCSYFKRRTQAKGRSSHCFVGRQANTVTASMMAHFVIKSIMSEANKKWKLQANPGPWWTSFCKGAADRIGQRCKELREAAEAQERGAKVPGTALVLAKFSATEALANQQFIADVMGIELKTKKVRVKAAGKGYADGVRFGSNVSLNRQVSGPTANSGSLT